MVEMVTFMLCVLDHNRQEDLLETEEKMCWRETTSCQEETLGGGCGPGEGDGRVALDGEDMGRGGQM